MIHRIPMKNLMKNRNHSRKIRMFQREKKGLPMKTQILRNSLLQRNRLCLKMRIMKSRLMGKRKSRNLKNKSVFVRSSVSMMILNILTKTVLFVQKR